MSWRIDLANGKDIVHTVSGKTIPAATAAVVSQEGVLVTEPVGYRFFPADELGVAAPPRLALLPEPDAPELPALQGDWVTKHVYFFGLDKLEAQVRSQAGAAGWIKENIAVASGDRIELLATEQIPAGASVEYSIVEAGVETPILPQGKTTVEQEIIFPGLPLRFVPDAKSPIRIFRNGVAAPLSASEAIQKNDAAVYSASYVASSGWQYLAQSGVVAVKIVLRKPPHAAGAPKVTSAVLRKWRNP